MAKRRSSESAGIDASARSRATRRRIFRQFLAAGDVQVNLIVLKQLLPTHRECPSGKLSCPSKRNGENDPPPHAFGELLRRIERNVDLATEAGLQLPQSGRRSICFKVPMTIKSTSLPNVLLRARRNHRGMPSYSIIETGEGGLERRYKPAGLVEQSAQVGKSGESGFALSRCGGRPDGAEAGRAATSDSSSRWRLEGDVSRCLANSVMNHQCSGWSIVG